MVVNHLNETNFDLTSKGIWLVNFYATWCGPCMETSYLKKLGESIPELNIARINTEENPNLTENYSIIIVPTYIFFANGKQSKRLVGIHNKESLQDHFNSLKGKS